MKKIIAVSALALTLGFSASAFANGGFAPQGGFNGPGLSPVTAAQAAKQSDDTAVVLVGKIERTSATKNTFSAMPAAPLY